MIVKKHLTSDKRLILAVCDEELIGRRIVDGKRQLDLSADFYKGEPKEEAETVSLMKKAFSIDAAGKNSVRCCILAGVVEDEKAPALKGVPYLQVVRF
jgi:hypothetical protein